MDNAVFGKTMKNIRKYRDNKLIATEKKEELFGIRINFSEYLLATEMRKSINNQVYQY